MFTEGRGSQRSPLSFCAVVISLVLLCSSDSLGDTESLERHEEQPNKLEQLRYDGKPAKIKRYFPAREHTFPNPEVALFVQNSEEEKTSLGATLY